MKFDSENLWKHASNVAYALNKAYEGIKTKKQSDKILKSYIEQIDNVSESCSKMTFVLICSFAAGYAGTSKTSLRDAVKYSMSLPVKGESEDDNMVFSYFMALVAFHLASYKTEWQQPMEEK